MHFNFKAQIECNLMWFTLYSVYVYYIQYVPVELGITGSMEMSSFLPNSEFAADYFLFFVFPMLWKAP